MSTTTDTTTPESTTPSPGRATTARENGAKSRGPITPEGKRRSSLNALKHGLASDSVLLLNDEDPAPLQAIMDSAHELYRPATALEYSLVDTIIGYLWRIRRAPDYEAAILHVEVQTAEPHFKEKFKVIDARTKHAVAFQRLSAGDLSPLAIARYEGLLTNAMLKTIRMLDDIQKRRIQQDQAPQPPIEDTDLQPEPEPEPEPEPGPTPPPTPNPRNEPTETPAPTPEPPPSLLTHDVSFFISRGKVRQ